MKRLRFTLTGRATLHGRRYTFEVFDPALHVREIRTEHVEQTAPASYTSRVVTPRRPIPKPVHYTTAGPLRGPCSHRHRHLDDAVECLDADAARCAEKGGNTDRQIFAVDSGSRRQLNADELAAVELYRRGRERQKPR